MPSQTWQTINSIHIDELEDEGIFEVAIAENEPGNGSYFLIQIMTDGPDDQDVATGMDTYCVLSDDEGHHYGGIEHVRIEDGELVMRFSEEAVSMLGIEGGREVRLALAISADDLNRLKPALRRVFRYGNPQHFPSLIGLE